MNKYWFYLEPSTFLFSKKKEILVYNSVSFSSRKFKHTPKLKKIVASLLEIGNMYCIEICEDEIKDKEVEYFVKYIRESFSGDLINSLIIKRPVIFPPIQKLQFNLTGLEKANFRDLGEEIIKVLNEVSIYIGGENPKSSLNKVEVFKQFDYCKKTDGMYISILKLKSVLKTLKDFHHLSLNIIGGNVFSYPDIEKLFAELMEISGIKYLYSSYCDIPLNSKIYSSLEASQIQLKVLIDFPVDFQILDLISESLIENNCNFEFLFAITSASDYNKAIFIIEKFSIKQYEIKPVFTGYNKAFFKKYVYLDENDLFQAQLSRNEIFLNQTINTINFGRLRIMENGLVYSGFNDVSIGSIITPLINLIHKELKKSDSWLKIRNQKPCKPCLYQWICPSPSGYELAVGKPNLCHIAK